jgi:hypothetical protein
MYASSPENINPFASPINAKDFHDLPPILIQVGGKEKLHDEGVALAGKLAKAGNKVDLEIYSDHFHAFHVFNFAASKIAFKRAAEFMLNIRSQSEVGSERMKDNGCVRKASKITICHKGIDIRSTSLFDVSKVDDVKLSTKL